ncbi:MAG: 4Fe-4S dicluster domain-containing protein, partial [Myxococcales bacterium]|nr:4Fe-4S dicluster domain-containing protein [Myxococcales bacterium]
PTPPVSAHCGSCSACLDACPTAAFAAPFVLDARRCLSYLTIEHEGATPIALRAAVGDWVFGCDVCQDVCPWNRQAPRAEAHRWQPQVDRAWPDLAQWIRAPSDGLHAQLEGSPLRRARGEGLRRNAMVVAANLGQVELLDALRAVAADADPVLRATAVWARRVLGDPSAAAEALADPHPMVQAEATTPLPSPSA